MTIYDYLMVMKKVGIAELKAKLSKRLREPLRRARSLQRVPLPPPLNLDVDVVDVLLEERQGER